MDDYGVDLEEIGRIIDEAEVLVVRFQVIEPRLLIDFRTLPGLGPLIKVVPRAGSIEERFRGLKALRPALPLPERILSFLWPRGIAAMQQAGVLARLQERLQALGGEGAQAAAEESYQALREEEAALLRAAIRGGEGFQSMWERPAS